MKLRLGLKSIQAVMKPYNASVIDILGINPRVEVGQFKGCALNVIPGRCLVITEGIIMMYNKFEDFLDGKDPLALVKDASIHYDQGLSKIDFQIVNDLTDEDTSADFAPVRELMFGARDEEDASTTTHDAPADSL